MPEMLIIVPTRGRPQSVQKVVDAWDVTGAFNDAALCFAIDRDDPQFSAYVGALDAASADVGPRLRYHSIPAWQPMVPKLNAVARLHASLSEYRALGFAGDDHLPRTRGWVRRYIEALQELGTGIVYGNDGFQGKSLPTEWAMTSDIVRALGAMVPGEVEHLYCDNIIRDIGASSGCLRYLPDVIIEHMHPAAGKAPVDAGYSHVNRPAQYASDQRAYHEWQLFRKRADVARVRALMKGGGSGE